jgi:hypothetical protein
VSLFAVVAAAALLDRDAGQVVAVVALVVLAGYCRARPSGGLRVFLAAAAPSAVAQLLHDAIDAPRWIAVLLLPVALWIVHEEDAATTPRDDAPPVAVR